jgi:hypothetical protein
MAAISTRVIVRNNIGQFIRDCEGAATATVKDALNEGVAIAKVEAPVGHRADSRTAKIIDSFYTRILGRTSGVFGNSARHALYQERGTGPHPIPGDVSFFWEKKWRMCEPGETEIQHPGNPAHPYLAPAYRRVMGRIVSIAARHYPG